VKIKTATAADTESVVSTVVMAFSADPAARWLYPDPHQYLRDFPPFVRAFGGMSIPSGTAYHVDGQAAALWLAPDVHPDEEELIRLLKHTTPPDMEEEVLSVFAQMGAYHPDRPHWYLPMIGVDLPYQSRGLGSALMRHALDACDRDGTLAYLESTNPRNISLYRRHGFEALGTIQLGSCPPIVPMVRKPRPR
jgi:GNAT superfamily N-acetyltransferase